MRFDVSTKSIGMKMYPKRDPNRRIKVFGVVNQELNRLALEIVGIAFSSVVGDVNVGDSEEFASILPLT
jgi:hypothetical protein